MKLIKPNWYGLNHVIVDQQFEGGLSFVNDFCVNGEYHPCAVYKVAKPNKAKGHKKYLLLSKDPYGMIIRGMTTQEMRKYRYQDAVYCHACDEVIYSINRHDNRTCSCGKCSIDGGREYTRISYEPDSVYENVTIDLLTDKIKSK